MGNEKLYWYDLNALFTFTGFNLKQLVSNAPF